MKKQNNLTQWTGSALIAGASLIGLSAIAQNAESLDSGVPNSAPEQPKAGGQEARLPISVGAGVSEQFNSDINNNNGVTANFSVTRVYTGVAVPVRLNDSLLLVTSGRYEFDRFNFGDTTGAPPGFNFWRNINTLSFASVLNWRQDDNWSYYGGGFVKFAAESGASLGQGATGGGLIGFNYKLSDELTIGAGFAGFSQIEEHAQFLPLITAKWKIADDWRLDVGLTDVATAGYGLDIKYLFSKELDFTLGAQAHKSRFRINALSDGVGQESSNTIYFDTAWHPNSDLDIDGFVGIAAGGKIRVDDNAGNKQFDSRYDAAGIIGGKVTLRF